MFRRLSIFLFAALLVFSFSSSLSFGIDAALYGTAGICTTDGNVQVTVLHKGGPLYWEDVSFTSSHQSNSSTGKDIALKGIFTTEKGEHVTYITSPSQDVLSTFIFSSQNAVLSKSGNYTIIIAYPKDSSAKKKSETSLIIHCPGKACSADIQCDFDAFCNKGICEYLQCNSCEKTSFNRCTPKCDDRNSCTTDYCNSGECTNEKIENCCRTVKDCDDGLACTKKNCVNSVCQKAPVQCVSNKDKCVAGTCLEPTGCIYKTDKGCLEKENEKRKYFIVVNDPTIEENRNIFEKIGAWFNSLVGGFFK